MVEATDDRRNLIISVTDQGIGIPSRLQEKIFNRFSQVENIVRGYKGQRDIGLYTCRDVFEAHGGKIWVNSRIGNGSRFSFSIPVITGNNDHNAIHAKTD